MHPASSQRLAERIAAIFVPLVLVLSAMTGIGWLLAGDASRAGLAALAVLVVACPCAMGIATPLATAVAIARAARQGIVVRGGDVMERIGQMRVLFFDKTGTLTTGKLSVVRVDAMDPAVSEGELFGWLAGLESGSEHAIARAIDAAAAQRHVKPGVVRDLEVSPGRGLRGAVTCGRQVHYVFAGTEEYLEAKGIKCPPPESADSASSSLTRVLVAWEERVRGAVFLSDLPRENAREAVARLKASGIEVRLLSGDRPGAVFRTAAETGITTYFASCLPDDKIGHVRAGQDGESPVGMAGDGINDAPALAAADVGIAIGAGTELARQSGNVVLMGSRLLDIPWLVELSRHARRVVKQNLLWALGYNLVAISAAVMGVLHPLLAALAMVISSLTVISNSARLARFPAPLDGTWVEHAQRG